MTNPDGMNQAIKIHKDKNIIYEKIIKVFQKIMSKIEVT